MNSTTPEQNPAPGFIRFGKKRASPPPNGGGSLPSPKLRRARRWRSSARPEFPAARIWKPGSCIFPRTMAVAYFGSSSIVRQMRSVCSQAMSVLPLPPNRSSTMLLGAELFLMGYASSGMGFIVRCSLLRLGLSKFQMVDCLRSANQRCFPLGSQPNSTGSCCH